MLYIFGVELHNLFKVGDVAAAADLPEAGDARFESKTGAVMILILLPFVHGGGTGADQTHLVQKYVEKLREFIQAGFADKLADAGLSGAIAPA